ncbi:MAG: PAS domain S-box protein [Acidobacteria bacterium]|nr:PAS domain S-box protein [Acidobacteriota bacterium]
MGYHSRVSGERNPVVDVRNSAGPARYAAPPPRGSGNGPGAAPGETRLIWAAALIAAVTFAVDLALPGDVGGGAPYTILLLLGLWSERPRFILVLALTATAQTVAGALLSPPGVPAWVWVLNRSQTLVAIWVITAFLLHYLRTRVALRESEREAEAYFEVAEVALVVLDREGEVRRINRKACAILGCDREAAVGKNWFRTFLPERVAADTERIFRRLIAGEVEPLEYYENPVRRADGSERLLAWHNAVVRDRSGAIVGTLSSGEDVTDRRRAEEERRRQEGLARIGQVAAVVAHEIRNPIAGIAGAIEILGRRLPEGNPDRAVIGDILERLDSLKRMSEDLLQFARPREPRFEPVELRALLRRAADLVGADPEFRGVGIEVSGPEVTLSGDPALLTQLFLNLILNAAQATAGQGPIEVTLENHTDGCRIGVRDRGPGIPAGIREQVFEPFFTTKHRGTGLGLAVARRVVEAHRGRISLDCPAEGGTTVQVFFPGETGH